LTSTAEYLQAGQAATKARDNLGRLFLHVARQAKVGLGELSATTGLHNATVRAMIRHAAGPGLPDGWSQPTLIELQEANGPTRPIRRQRTDPDTSANATVKSGPTMRL
jgi:hypothetical protein